MVLPKQEIKKQILDEVFWHRIHQAHPLVLDATHRFVPWNEDIFARLDRPAIPPKPQPAGDSFRLHAPTDEEMAAYKASPKLTWGEHYALGYPTDPAIVETFYEIPEQVDVADGFIRWDYNGEGVRPIHGGLHHERCGCEDKTDPEVVPVSEPEPEPVRHVRSDSCSSTDSMSSIDSNGFPLRSVYGRLRPGEVRVPVPDYDAARSAASSGQGDSGQGGS
ncbi:hypothetical protein BJ878DRAFT_48442 [Calycina marina]|uniref:Uncharacterized protein n=1 Tax=Calycina marina TaxID=1763456 RepID=A0A9P8CGX0_9HELO|nr:hypothetical protein BJ878DRAFT_48442 [Calycina marina]